MNAIIETINAAGQAFIRFALPMFIQSSVLILILLLLDMVLRRKVRAVFRYWIWMLVLLKLVLPPSLWSPVSIGTWLGETLEPPAIIVSESPTLESQERSIAEPVDWIGDGTTAGLNRVPEGYTPTRRVAAAGDSLPMEAPEAAEGVSREPIPDRATAEVDTTSPTAAPLNWQALVLLAWVAIALALLLLLMQRAWFVRGLIAQSQEAPPRLRNALNQCCLQMGVKRAVPIRVSSNATSPAVCGLFRPSILIPNTLVPRLQPHDLQAVLLHELAHIKRGDLWVNLIQTLLQVIYFYNPSLWLATVLIRRVREQAVDEGVVVAMGETACDYPETLLNVAKLTFRQRPALSLRLIGVVESKSALSARIKHILTRPFPKSARLGLFGLVVVLLVAVVLLPMAKARAMTDRARKVMALAEEEARQLNHSYVGTEHLLLALARQEDAISARVLDEFAIDIDTVRAEVLRFVQPGTEPVTRRTLPRTPRAKRVMQYATEEARALNHDYIGTEHLLLGLLHEKEGIAAQVLTDLDLTWSQVRAETLRFVRPGDAARSGPTVTAPDKALYEKAKGSRRLRTIVGPHQYGIDAVVRWDAQGRQTFEDGRGRLLTDLGSKTPDYSTQACWMDIANIYVSPGPELYDVLELRIFDHETKELLRTHDGICIGYDIRNSIVQLRSVGGPLPDTVDVWFRLLHNPSDQPVWKIEARPGASIDLDSGTLSCREIRDGQWSYSMNQPASTAQGQIQWRNQQKDGGAVSTVVLDLGPSNRWSWTDSPRYQICAIARDGTRVVPDFPHFIAASMPRGDTKIIEFELPPEQLSHFEVRPFNGRDRFFFEAVKLPRVSDQGRVAPPAVPIAVDGKPGELALDALDPVRVHVQVLPGRRAHGTTGYANRGVVKLSEGPIENETSETTVIYEIEGLSPERVLFTAFDRDGHAIEARSTSNGRTHNGCSHTVGYQTLVVPLERVASLCLLLGDAEPPRAMSTVDRSERRVSTGQLSNAVREGETTIVLPDVDHEAVMLDLATMTFIAVPKAESPDEIWQAIREGGRGDFTYDGRSLILVRGATCPQAENRGIDPFSACAIGSHLPQVLTITTAEGQRYRITILAADKMNCTLTVSAIPADEGAGGGALVDPPEDQSSGVVAELPNGVTVELLAYSHLVPRDGLFWFDPQGQETTVPGVYEADVEGLGTVLAIRVQPREAHLVAQLYRGSDSQNVEKQWQLPGTDIWLLPLRDERSFANLRVLTQWTGPPAIETIALNEEDLGQLVAVNRCGIASIVDLQVVESFSADMLMNQMGQPSILGTGVATAESMGLQDVAEPPMLQFSCIRERGSSQKVAAFLDKEGRTHPVEQVQVDATGATCQGRIWPGRLAGILVEASAVRAADVRFRNLSLTPERVTEIQIEPAARQEILWKLSYRHFVLEALTNSLRGFCERHGGRFPASLADLQSSHDPDAFRWITTHMAYVGQGKSLDDDPPSVIAYDQTLLAQGQGTYVFYSDARLEFESPVELAELGIFPDGSGPDVWQETGVSVPPDANDSRALTSGIRLNGIGSNPDDRVFVSTVRDTTATEDVQYRFVLMTKAGQMLEPIYYGSFEQDDGKLWEKYTFDSPYHHRKLGLFRLQRRLATGQVAVAPTAHGEILSAASDVPASPVASQAPPGRYALAFDGKDDYLYVPDSRSLREARSLTIEMWVKPQFPPGPYDHRPGWALLAKGGYLGTGRVSGRGFAVTLRKQDDRPDSIMFSSYRAAEDSMLSTMTLWPQPDDWMHISETFERDSFIPAPGYPLVFGRFLIPTENPFQGEIAEIRIWDATKSGSTSKYENGPLTGTETGLLACWTFEEGAGPIARDLSPHANHARLGSSVAPDDADPTWLDLQVPDSATKEISGRVLDPNGAPVAGAQAGWIDVKRGVTITDGRLMAPRFGKREGGPIVETDERGWFRFEEEPNDGFSVVAAHKVGFALVGSEQFAHDRVIQLQRWGRVEGQVAQGREPLEGKVWMGGLPNSTWFEHRRDYRYERICDSAGRFTFDRVPPGWFEVGYLIETGDGSASLTSRTPVVVESGKTATVTLGGEGRPVVGQFVPPPDWEGPVYFGAGLRALDTVHPERPTPDNYDQMTQRERQEWITHWYKTPEADEYRETVWHDLNRRHYTFRIAEDGTFRIEDVIPGKYNFTVWLEERDNHEGPGEFGGYSDTVEVPPMNEAYSDEPLDVGDLVLRMRRPFHVGDMAPPFEAKTLDGKEIRLADYRGRFVLLNFWSPVFNPEVDRLKELRETYHDSGKLQIIGLGGTDTLEEVKKYVEENDIEWPEIYFGPDWDGDLFKRLGGQMQIMLIDPEGKVVATWLRGEKLTDTVRQAIGNAKPEISR